MKHIFYTLMAAVLLACNSQTEVTESSNNEKDMKQYSVHFENKDVLFIDLVWLNIPDGVWEEHWEEFAENKGLEYLGYSNGITFNMTDVYKPYLIDSDCGEVIGDIQLDSYIVACLDMDEVLKTTPDLMSFIQTSPVIKNFTGDITFTVAKEHADANVDLYEQEYDIVTIIGRGSKNFHSVFYSALEKKSWFDGIRSYLKKWLH